MNNNENICWYQNEVIDAMNDFYDKCVKNMSLTEQKQSLARHLHYFCELFKLIEIDTDKDKKIVLDIGSGTAMISPFCKEYGFEYIGSDLPHILSGCSMRNFPENYYRSVDILNDDLKWIKQYPVILVNAIIDVMENPLQILEKILQNTRNYLLIHRQEISEQRETQVVKRKSYNSYTYHSIINRKDFNKLIDKYSFEIVKEEKLEFYSKDNPDSWENGGSSFLIKPKKMYALYEMDKTLYQKYFEGIEDAKFLDIGANDGLNQSNTYYFEHHKNWTGILVEAIPELAVKCNENRSRASVTVNAAVVSDSYSGKSIEMIYTPECRGLLSCVNNKNAEKLMKRTSEEGIKMSVPALSLNEILQLFSGKFGNHFNLMSIDIEGYEIEAFKGIDFDKWVIDYILVEELEENDEIKNLLSTHYERVELFGEHDWLYKRKS